MMNTFQFIRTTKLCLAHQKETKKTKETKEAAGLELRSDPAEVLRLYSSSFASLASVKNPSFPPSRFFLLVSICVHLWLISGALVCSTVEPSPNRLRNENEECDFPRARRG